MAKSHAERLERVRANCLWAWRRVRASEVDRARVVAWLAQHPCDPDVDEVWRRALEGDGALAIWLDEGAPLERWPFNAPSARVVLASHPFAPLPRWFEVSSPTT